MEVGQEVYERFRKCCWSCFHLENEKGQKRWVPPKWEDQSFFPQAKNETLDGVVAETKRGKE